MKWDDLKNNPVIQAYGLSLAGKLNRNFITREAPPREICLTCGNKLDIKDPKNEGYCDGKYCRFEAICNIRTQLDTKQLEEWAKEQEPVYKGNRKERRAAAAKARKRNRW